MKFPIKFPVKPKDPQPMKTPRPKLKLKKKTLVYILGGVIIGAMIISLLCMPYVLDDKKMAKMGYSKEGIGAIRDQGLVSLVLQNEYYSDNMQQAIINKTFDKEYAALYAVTSSTTSDDIRLYNTLQWKGYTQEQVLKLFQSLEFHEITPLLVFDLQTDVEPYINDCISNDATNNANNFVLTNNYYTPYLDVQQSQDQSGPDVLVNKTFSLAPEFAPSNLTGLSARYAANGVELDEQCVNDLKDMIDQANGLGLRMFVSSAYRSYDEQAEIYDSYVGSLGQETADIRTARPGHSEHETGLALDMAAVTEEDMTFVETQEYTWLKENSYNYGWIIRYPEGKESITGYNFESWHYRYVGKDLAISIHNTGLTYDEYYLLYLYNWPNAPEGTEDAKPSVQASATTEEAEGTEQNETTPEAEATPETTEQTEATPEAE